MPLRVPLPILPLLHLPKSVLRTTHCSLPSRTSDLSRLPSFLRPSHLYSRALLNHLRAELNQTSWSHRDRFLEPNWRRRIHWLGARHPDEALSQDRGIVLATIHYGPLTFLGRWLFARGQGSWRMASLVDDPAWIDPRRRDSRGRRIAPRIIRHDQIRRAHRFLEKGGILLVGIDFPRGKTIPISVDDRILPIATGPLRMAAATGATVIPVIALDHWWWRGEVRFSEPVPDELINDPSRHPAACGYIVTELMKTVRQQPLQSAELLLRQFQDASPAP